MKYLFITALGVLLFAYRHLDHVTRGNDIAWYIPFIEEMSSAWVIGLTALATEEDRKRCLAAGMDDYLPKPTNFHALATTLSRWLPKPNQSTPATPPE